MRQAWHLRLLNWKERTEHHLRSKWWWWPVLFAAELSWHYTQERTIHFLSTQSGRMFEIALVVASSLTPLVVIVGLSLIVIVGLAVHAYFETRRQTYDETMAVLPNVLGPADEWLRRVSLDSFSDAVSHLCAFPVQNFIKSSKPEECAQMITGLIDDYPLADLKRAYARMRASYSETPNSDSMTVVLDALSAYKHLAGWVLWTSRAFPADAILAGEQYSAWHNAHLRFAGELREAVTQDATHQIAAKLLDALPDLPPPASPPQMASAESLERFREVYFSACQRPFQYAYEFLFTLAHDSVDSDEKLYVTRLVQAYMLPKRNEFKERLDLDAKENRPLRQDEFSERLWLFRRALGNYIEMIAEIKRLGPFLKGEPGFKDTREVQELTRLHAKCVEELRRVHGRSDLADMASLYLQTLETILPTPS
jgi:hypothetical protein